MDTSIYGDRGMESTVAYHCTNAADVVVVVVVGIADADVVVFFC